MKNQALFSSKDIIKKKCFLLQFLFGASRVNIFSVPFHAALKKLYIRILSENFYGR